ncbi:MAG: MFS transporter, partial [Candidatus Methanomethylophilaceae archaeon]|nr:MFS transporter [Candidatus Methanomethylophilaceae archaeon]
GTLISRFTTGRIYDAHGANPVVLPGYVSFIIGMIMFASTDYVPLFMLSGFLMGYGISIIYAICQAIVVTSSPAHRYGETSATFGSLRDMGSGFGPFILGTVLAATGYHQMYLICAGVSFCSLFMYWAIHGHKEFRQKHPEGC